MLLAITWVYMIQPRGITYVSFISPNTLSRVDIPEKGGKVKSAALERIKKLTF